LAQALGIPASAAITCVKPSGTVSQLCDTASGIHPRYSQYYIRTIRQDKKDPLTRFLIEQKVHTKIVYISQSPLESLVFQLQPQLAVLLETIDLQLNSLDYGSSISDTGVNISLVLQCTLGSPSGWLSGVGLRAFRRS